MAWWVGGVLATFISCMCSAFGNVLKRLARASSRHKRQQQQQRGSCSGMWFAGFVLMILPLPLDGYVVVIIE